jgi:mono/diheme cytochrome c family protein
VAVRRRYRLKRLLFSYAFLFGFPTLVLAQPEPSPSDAARAPLPVHPTGKDVYEAACLACHGLDGKGSPRATVGFAVALPDFTDCAFATAESDQDWHPVVHEGGRIRGLDHHMPAFGDALSPEEIALAVGHVRTFCADSRWPRGDLNLPRAFLTEKAFPENEAVWATTFTGRGERSVGNELIYERRLGARNQIEVNVPIVFQEVAPGPSETEPFSGTWTRGLGDVAVAFKRTVYGSMRTGRIAAAGMEIALPTGKEELGLGNGYTVFEPFAMWGQILPRNSFLQMHGGVELPSDTVNGAREAYLRTAVGTTFFQDRGFGRAWSPQLEVLWARPEHGAPEWDVVPQVQVTLSKIQHVRVAAGARIPVTQREERHTQVLAYLLWDWFDGGFFEFWK